MWSTQKRQSFLNAIQDNDIETIKSIRDENNSAQWYEKLNSLKGSNGEDDFYEIMFDGNTTPEAAKAIIEGLNPKNQAELLIDENIIYHTTDEDFNPQRDSIKEEIAKNLKFGACFVGVDLADLSHSDLFLIKEEPIMIASPEQLTNLFKGDSDKPDSLVRHFNENKKAYKQIAEEYVLQKSNAADAGDISERNQLLKSALLHDKPLLDALRQRETYGKITKRTAEFIPGAGLETAIGNSVSSREMLNASNIYLEDSTSQSRKNVKRLLEERRDTEQQIKRSRSH